MLELRLVLRTRERRLVAQQRPVGRGARMRGPQEGRVEREGAGLLAVVRVVPAAHVPVSGLGRRFSALGGPLEGWQVALKRLGALPRIRRGAQGRGCGREGSGALLLARAAAVSTGLRVPAMLAHSLVVRS